MLELVYVPIENELDLSLAYRRSIKVAELLKLSISMRTSFATAVSEVCRELIDKASDGALSVRIEQVEDRYFLVGLLSYIEVITLEESRGGLAYASKLVPEYRHKVLGGKGEVMLKLTVPRTSRVSHDTLQMIKSYFEFSEPATPYEELRKRNVELFHTNEQSVLALRSAEYIIDQKNEFLSVASHELRTPLTILRAFTQLALRNVKGTDLEASLDKIDTQAKKMQDMISQLLDISNSEVNRIYYNLESIEINSFLSSLEDLLKSLVPAHSVLIAASDMPILVQMDRLRMEQVINNLVGNAAKYSAPNSDIIVKAVLSPDKRSVLLSVSDKGIGMKQEEIHKVFEKFYRVSEVSHKIAGLGVGLYISSKIVADHGGKIWVESQEGVGSVFYVSLPTVGIVC